MPPRNGKRRADVDIHRAVTRGPPVPVPPTTQERHIHYEPNQAALHTFLSVPSSPPSHPSDARHAAAQDVDRELPDLMPIDDDSDEEGEDDRHELEAAGLSNSIQIKRKRARTQADHPLAMWTPYIDTYVNELLRLEGRGDLHSQSQCAQAGCEASIICPGFRCRDCHNFHFYCGPCMVESHSSLPFHRIQMWNGISYEKTSLKALGLRIQLGHPDNDLCPLPQPAFNNDFTVIDSDGIHQVSIQYCGCERSLPKHIQLLRARLFPSTTTDPRTAATFRVLDAFQVLSFTSKVSAFEYYRSLARRTDNTGTAAPPDRYHAFLRIIREWRHTRLLKRMGRGHSDSGVKGTAEGELAVTCPACPIPGVNLPEDWESRPEKDQWLYSLFLGIDANFRLKRMNVSTDERDPGLNHGYAYVVEDTKFKAYLAEFDEKIVNDKSTCNNHDAIKSASMRGGKGTAASGLGTTECSRHDMKRATSVGDLQKGERYVNMDYFFLSSIQTNPPRRLVVSYDIACQWSRKLDSRCAIYPSNSISSQDLVITYLVPKFHLPAHVSQCQIDYSFNLVPGVGRTDGEAPERGWSAANAVASSTREMGPGSRRDTLDDHFGDYNWAKIAQLAETFIRKSEDAIKSREEYVAAFVEFDAALPADLTSAWTTLCQTWESDRSKENPFFNKHTAISDSQVRLRLAQEDAAALAAGERATLHEDVSPSMLIYRGLEYEELQRRLARDVAELGPHSTNLQKAKVLERSNSLRRRIDAWIEIQHLYIPGIAALRARADNIGGGVPPAVQDLELFLPSQVVGMVPVDHHLLRHEFDLRISQAGTTLDDIRSSLLLRSHMTMSKQRHVRGQLQNTKSNTLLARVQAKVDAAANKYKEVLEALVNLSGPLLEFDWQRTFREILPDDMKGLTSLDDEGSEGRKKLTWLWTVEGTGLGTDVNGRTDAALRIEWCKARARAHRWQEECLLLREEMHRVIESFTYQACQWTMRAQKHATMVIRSSRLDPRLAAIDITAETAVREGKVGYAYYQAAIRQKMKEHCIKTWEGLSDRLGAMDDRDATVMVECHVS